MVKIRFLSAAVRLCHVMIKNISQIFLVIVEHQITRLLRLAAIIAEHARSYFVNEVLQH